MVTDAISGFRLFFARAIQKRIAPGASCEVGVGDGIRTRDVQIHSLALYQLSYTHRTGLLRWP